MLIHPHYEKRVVAIERWSVGTVVATSVCSCATAGALGWIFREAIRAGAADRIVVAILACLAIGFAVPLRWCIARKLDGGSPQL